MTRREDLRRVTSPAAEYGRRFFSERHEFRVLKLYTLPDELARNTEACELCDAPIALSSSLANGKVRAVKLELMWEWEIARKDSQGEMRRWTIRHNCPKTRRRPRE